MQQQHLNSLATQLAQKPFVVLCLLINLHMANSSSISAKPRMLVVLFMIIFLLCHFISIEGRILGDNIQDVQNKYDSHFVLSKAGFSLTEIEEYTRRSLKGGSDRVAPGGPDPQHHSLPPTN